LRLIQPGKPETISDPGSLVADVLAGAWRVTLDADDLSTEELTRVLSPLLGSGAGALGWCKIRHSALQDSPIAFEFKQAYRLHTLEAVRHERDLETIFSVLRSSGVEPLLIKGWSIARIYPEKGMRPYEDADLVVRRDQYLRAQAIIHGQKEMQFYVDLHGGLDEFGYGSEDDLFANSQLVRLGDVDVRVPSPEDSLRIVCVHFLRHGAFRPLWLCDVAVSVESRPADFDWDRCLGRNNRAADWVACAIGLAHRLLGARIDDTPVKGRAESLPSWLVPTVLKQWEKPFGKDHGVGRHRAPMGNYLRQPSGVFEDIGHRWPNPIEATVYMRGPFNELPRFPFQIGECVARAAKFLARLPKAVREGR
jgi:Uncharacterised nucleotidyltransferase